MNGGLGEGEQAMVELIFGPEKAPRPRPVGGTGRRQRPDVAARAKATSLRVIDQHHRHLRIGPPHLERRQHRLAHGEAQRVDLLRPVQTQPTGMAVDGDDDLVRHGISHSTVTDLARLRG